MPDHIIMSRDELEAVASDRRNRFSKIAVQALRLMDRNAELESENERLRVFEPKDAPVVDRAPVVSDHSVEAEDDSSEED